MSRSIIGLVVYALLAWFGWRLGRGERRLWLRAPTSGQAAWALLAIPLVFFKLGAFWTFWSLVGPLAPGLREALLRGMVAGGGPGAADLLLGLLIGPVVEELLFRGALLPVWARRMGWGRALILQALVFAVWHVNPLGSFVVALLAGLLYMRTRSLWPPIMLHALTNALSGLPWRASGLADGPTGDLVAALHADAGLAVAALAFSLPPIALAGYVLWRGDGDDPDRGRAGASSASSLS